MRLRWPSAQPRPRTRCWSLHRCCPERKAGDGTGMGFVRPLCARGGPWSGVRLPSWALQLAKLEVPPLLRLRAHWRAAGACAAFLSPRADCEPLTRGCCRLRNRWPLCRSWAALTGLPHSHPSLGLGSEKPAAYCTKRAIYCLFKELCSAGERLSGNAALHSLQEAWGVWIFGVKPGDFGQTQSCLCRCEVLWGPSAPVSTNTRWGPG